LFVGLLGAIKNYSKEEIVLQSIIAGVDVGFGRLKALSLEHRLEYPSVVGPWRELRYRSELNSSSFLEHMAVEYAGQKLFIGEEAYRQSKARVNMSPERFCSSEGMALLLSALAVLAHSRNAAFNLVTGLPVNAFASQKDRYNQTLAGRHYIKLLCPDGNCEERYLTIADVKVVPQPMGTVFSYVLDASGKLTDRELASARLAVLDIGANTVDLCRVDSLQFVDRESTSFSDIGVFECYKQISLEILNSFGIEIPAEEIEPHIMNSAIKVGGRLQSIDGIKDRVFYDAAERIVSRALNVWRSTWQLDKIFVTGGGAVLFGEQVARVLNSPGQVEVCKQGTFSNTLGYLRLGQRAWLK
jgi:plasmid segregation protein ParM